MRLPAIGLSKGGGFHKLTIRITPEQNALFRAAARRSGIGLGRTIVIMAEAWARKDEGRRG